ncbi:GH10900 [Drosophila grimshawi]|uniref:GH10900 n=1 Tax=Drosophila grimshawi TaxID=7222 RepID=B4JAN0_DROGR|nr:GH10900 [Drosophila grimshawi]
MISGSVCQVVTEAEEEDGDNEEKEESEAEASNNVPLNAVQCPIVKGPQIVLISYAKRYTDIARLMRLRFIAQVCPKLRVEALELAINNVKKTYNVKMYEELYRKLCMERKRSVVTPESSEAASPSTSKAKPKSEAHLYDAYWVEDNTMEATLLLQELDAELNFKKSNSGSAYVRRILEEIGDYHVKSGNFQLAIKFYARARPYCTSSDNVIHMFRNLIRVSIYMANWWHVLSYIEEAKQYALGFPDLMEAVPAQLSCAAGLANMGLKVYKTAAQCFLLTPFEGYDYDKIVAPQDVAYYAGLCSLATLDLEMLQLGCLNSVTLRPFFDLSPDMWGILLKFIGNKFDSCVQLLHGIENHIRLDVYLAPHVDALYKKIMTRIQDSSHTDGLQSNDNSSIISQELKLNNRRPSVYFPSTDS